MVGGVSGGVRGSVRGGAVELTDGAGDCVQHETHVTLYTRNTANMRRVRWERRAGGKRERHNGQYKYKDKKTKATAMNVSYNVECINQNACKTSTHRNVTAEFFRLADKLLVKNT